LQARVTVAVSAILNHPGKVSPSPTQYTFYYSEANQTQNIILNGFSGVRVHTSLIKPTCNYTALLASISDFNFANLSLMQLSHCQLKRIVHSCSVAVSYNPWYRGIANQSAQKTPQNMYYGKHFRQFTASKARVPKRTAHFSCHSAATPRAPTANTLAGPFRTCPRDDRPGIRGLAAMIQQRTRRPTGAGPTGAGPSGQ
jgi:hypothetical protein